MWSDYPVIRHYERLGAVTFGLGLLRSIWSGETLEGYDIHTSDRRMPDPLFHPSSMDTSGRYTVSALQMNGEPVRIEPAVPAGDIIRKLPAGAYLRLHKRHETSRVQETLFVRLADIDMAVHAAGQVAFHMKFTPFPVMMDQTREEFDAAMQARKASADEHKSGGFLIQTRKPQI